MRHPRWCNDLTRLALVRLALVATVVIVPRVVSAHAVGTSRGEYTLHGRTVTVALLFAREELVSIVPELDADRDGVVADRELRLARAALTHAIVGNITIDDGEERCTGALDDAALAEGDALSIRATYRCSTSTPALTARLGFLDLMAHGHRHFAVTNGDARAETIAYAGHAAILVSAGVGLWTVSLKEALQIFWLGAAQVLARSDSLVFLTALMLVGGETRSRLLSLAAFTVGHVLALGCATFASHRFPGPPMALAVVYVAVENWFVADAEGRWLVTFPFGLAYGFGIADALQGIPLERSQLPVALSTFVSGIEVAQLAVVVLVLFGLRALRETSENTERRAST